MIGGRAHPDHPGALLPRPPLMQKIGKRLYDLGGQVSEPGANLAGHPAAILGMAVFCLIWSVIAGPAAEIR